MNESVTVPAVPLPSHITFINRRPDFRRLVMRGALLELVTVGFYRFWLATDMRRHLWSHSSVEGDSLEYTGTAKELLIGFLFALAILVPIYVTYFLIGLEVERVKAFASIPLGLFFYLFAQFAVYRARRYRLTRTVWRGVRFWMTGSGWNYAWRVVLWTLLVALTLGIALPWRQAALERFKMRYTSYGNLSGRFVGKGWELFKRGWWLWLAAVLIIIVPIGLAALLASQKTKGGEALAALVPFLLLIAAPFIYGMYKATEWRWWVSGIRFGSVYFESSLRRGELIGLYWKTIGWNALFFLVLTIWFGIVFGIAYSISGLPASNAQKFANISQRLPVLIGIGFGYVAYILVFWMIMRIYLVHDVWRRVADSVTVHNLGAAENVIAQGPLVGALGEGFADSLDVVGF